jgi:hypothetical protein
LPLIMFVSILLKIAVVQFVAHIRPTEFVQVVVTGGRDVLRNV